MRARSTRIILFGLAAILAVVACSAPGVSKEPVAGGTFVVALDSPVLTLDPANITELSSARVATQLYETLVEFNSETGKVVPLLAQTWAVSADGRLWTFTLRSGVTFHDGTPLNADAVVENFNRWLDTANPYHSGDFDYWQILFGGFKDKGSIVRSVQRMDDLRFSVTLEQPWTPLLAALSMFPFSIVSPTAMQKDPDGLRQHPVGTGPFRVPEWRGAQEITLAANAAYWGGRPKIDAVRFEVVADPAARLTALKDGTSHLAIGADAGMVAAARKMTGLKELLRPGQSVAFLSINQKADPYGDPRVRQALSYAINRRALVDKAYGGLAQVADGFVPPSLAGRDTEATDAYNQATARKMLGDAGYGGGIMTQLWYPAHPRPAMPNPKAMADSIAADLRALGILVAVNSADWATFQQRVLDGAYPLYIQTWTGDSPDVDSYLGGLFGSDTTAKTIGYSSPELKTMLTTARVQRDDERVASYNRAAATILGDMPRIPLVYPQAAVLVGDKVDGFTPSALNVESFRGISLKK